MKTVLWVSRHKPLSSQINELRRLFGDNTRIIVDQRQFTSAESIVKRFKENKADELVLVAPLTVCRVLIDTFNIYPLFAEMKRVTEKQAEVRGNGRRELISGEDRQYRFIRFKRLRAVNIVLEDIKKEV